jgi:PAS domain S-box-containing protein
MDETLKDEVIEVFENAPCGYLSTHLDGTILRANQTFLDWTCQQREDLAGKRLQDLLTVPGKIFYETQYFPLLQMQGSVKAVALDLLRKGGEPLAVLVNSKVQASSANGQALIHSAFFDATDRTRYELELLLSRRELQQEVLTRTADLETEIAERKRAEDELRELTSRLLLMRDDERRRLARELHDSVGQMLAALSMNLALIEADADRLSPRASQALSENARWVTEISAEIRTISHLLHPPLLDEVGLESALTWYVDGLAQRAEMKINLLMAPELGRLPEEQELAVFRIVQECLTNVHRHSGSKTAAVRVSVSGGGVRVEVEDQGSGIPAEKLKALWSSGSGVGLKGMRERARQLGGKVNVTSSSRGTVVVTTFPRP